MSVKNQIISLDNIENSLNVQKYDSSTNSDTDNPSAEGYYEPPVFINKEQRGVHKIFLSVDDKGVRGQERVEALEKLTWRADLALFGSGVISIAREVANRYLPDTVGKVYEKITEYHEEVHLLQEIRMKAPSTGREACEQITTDISNYLDADKAERDSAKQIAHKSLEVYGNQYSRQIAFMEAQAWAVSWSHISEITPDIEDSIRIDILKVAEILANGSGNLTALEITYSQVKKGCIDEYLSGQGTVLAEMILMSGNANLIEDIEENKISVDEFESMFSKSILEYLQFPKKLIDKVTNKEFMIELDRRLYKETLDMKRILQQDIELI